MCQSVAVTLDPLEEHLLERLRSLPADGEAPPEAEALWRAQVDSRLCDFAARELKSTGRSFYSIGSAGHESNAAVALALRPTDPALLHYRSGAFYLARAGQVGRDGVPDILHGVTAATEEPIAGGRHKVFGHHELAVIPQTSTIASHLPRAVGVAFAIERARKLGLEHKWQPDAVVVCSFGDASVEPRDGQAALNSAASLAYQGLPLPLLFVCEDNGLGISVRSPSGWVESALRARAALRYEAASGRRPGDRARDRLGSRRVGARATRARQCFTCASCASSATRAPTSRPPTARRRRSARTGTPTRCSRRDRAVARPRRAGGRVPGRARACVRHRVRGGRALPQLESAEEVMRPLAPSSPLEVPAATASDEPVTLAQAINSALADELERDPRVLLFGEDVAVKGGVYGVTRGLQKRFGAGRVFDTLLDETSILGLALGTARQRAAAGAGDPVPRVPAQRRGPAARRGGDAAVLLAGPVPERNGGPDRGARLPEGLRRPLPQRRRRRRAARHPGDRDRVAGAARRCGGDAAHVLRGGARGRARVRLPRADRAVPHARSLRGRRRRVARAGPRTTLRSAPRASTATAAT